MGTESIPTPMPPQADKSPALLAEPVRTSIDAKSAVLEGATRKRLYPGNDQVVNLSARKPVGNSGDGITLNFDRAPLVDVVHSLLGDVLKKPYSVEAELAGEVTLRTAGPVARADVGQVLEATLASRGFSMVADAQGLVHIGANEAMRSLPSSLGQSVGRGLSVVPLQHIGAREMADILKPLAPADALVRVDATRNLLLLQGTQAQTQTWLDLVHTFDVDAMAGMSVGIFAFENADVRETAKIIEMLASKGDNPLEGLYRIVPIERLNSLLVIAPRRHLLDNVRQWVERLDQATDHALQPQLHVYPVQQGNAAQLAKVLGALFGSKTATSADATRGALAPGLASATASAARNTSAVSSGATGTQTSAGSTGAGAASGASTSPARSNSAASGAASTVTPNAIELEGDIRIVADESTNSLLIYAPKRAFRRVEAAMRQLDVAPAQVLIEATIVEVTLSDKLQYGLQWFFTDALGSGKTGVGSLTRSTTSSALSRVLPGFNYTISDSAGGIRAVLNALASETGLKVVSSPSVLALDNHPAEIRVGNQQPILSGTTTTTGGNVTQSITYKDTGVMLRVTPRVNSGGLVTLDIAQEVTDVGAVDAATGQRTFLQRSMQSRIAIPSGQTAVLGGLIKDNTSNNRSGLPFLSEIPILGAVFGAHEKSLERTELLVVLTPRVLENAQQLRDISDEIRARMPGFWGGNVAK
jgi:general secretion pathway protein D